MDHVQGGPKNGTACVEPLTLSNINRFSKFFHCQNQPYHASRVSLHYLVKCQCLKSNNWKQDDFCNNTF